MNLSQIEERVLHHKKQCSRRLALQAMYQWHFTNESSQSLIKQYQQDSYWAKADHDYFIQIITGSIQNLAAIDKSINAVSEYPTKNIDPIELAALRIAVYELMYSVAVPEKVITSEAIRLCKKFGSDEGYKLVNAILDKLMKTRDRTQIIQKN